MDAPAEGELRRRLDAKRRDPLTDPFEALLHTATVADRRRGSIGQTG
jgi:hypothetical protein